MGRTFDSHGGLRVEVGGIDVSQPPVLRTVLLNHSSNSLYEISFSEDEVELLAWERAADALWNMSTTVQRRRAKGAKGAKTSKVKEIPVGTEKAAVSTDARYSKDWYKYWSGLMAAEKRKGEPVVFHADESYACSIRPSTTWPT